MEKPALACLKMYKSIFDFLEENKEKLEEHRGYKDLMDKGLPIYEKILDLRSKILQPIDEHIEEIKTLKARFCKDLDTIGQRMILYTDLLDGEGPFKRIALEDYHAYTTFSSLLLVIVFNSMEKRINEFPEEAKQAGITDEMYNKAKATRDIYGPLTEGVDAKKSKLSEWQRKFRYTTYDLQEWKKEELAYFMTRNFRDTDKSLFEEYILSEMNEQYRTKERVYLER